MLETAKPDNPKESHLPFAGPFWLKGGWVDPATATGPLGAMARRLHRLGQWARGERWWFDGLLGPVSSTGTPETDWLDVLPQVSWLPHRQLGQPLQGARLDRSLGEVVAAGPRDWYSVLGRIDAATAYRVELVLDFQDEETKTVTLGAVIDGKAETFKATKLIRQRGACRSALILPPVGGNRIPYVPRLAVAGLPRHLFGVVQLPAPRTPRKRPLDDIASEAAAVHRDGPRYGANKRVAEHFGWRDESAYWPDDEAGRRRVQRVRKRAKELGVEWDP